MDNDELAGNEINVRPSDFNETGKYGMTGTGPAMQEVYSLIEKAAGSEAGVIIYGESGSGKELAAGAIHRLSRRCDNPFVPVNCGAIPENLLESEFFGYAKGAFTGAQSDTPGFLDLADGGTLFLDEIGELDINLQVKLLRAIEGGGYTPVGSRKIKYSSFRIIAATNLDLAVEMKAGRMRPDFYYRIHVIPLRIPSLKERKEDIPLLVSHFLKKFGAGTRTLPKKMSDALKGYSWPGNIRELQNVIQRYVVMKSIDFTGCFIENQNMDNVSVTDSSDSSSCEDRKNFSDSVDELEKKLIIESLEKNGFKRSVTASEMGISRRTLYRKMKKFGILSEKM
jgi:transcriptional regulator with PAS, ATPase and Fis domain